MKGEESFFSFISFLKVITPRNIGWPNHPCHDLLSTIRTTRVMS